MTTTPTLWRAASQANTADGKFAQTNSDIVALPDGGYLIVWEDRTLRGDIDMRGQRYNALGNKVGREIPIEVVTDSQTVPKLVAFADGRVLVAFSDNFGGLLDTWVDRFDANLKHYPDPSSAHNILRDSIERWGWDSSDPQISVLGGGRYVVTFTMRAGSPDTNDLDVYAQIMNADGSKGALVRVNTDAVNADQAEVATLANGNFVTVYRHESDRVNRPGDHDVLFQISDVNGNVVKSDAVAGAADIEDAIQPAVAALHDGGFAVAWTEAYDGSGQGVKVTVFNAAGTAIKSNVAVNTTTLGNQNQAEIIALADGGFLVVFEDDQVGVVRGQRFDANGNTIGSQFKISNGVGGGGPHGVLLSDGRVAFALSHFTGKDQDVFTSIWDPRDKTIDGTDANETITSRKDGAEVHGLGGDDTLIGFNGADTLDGGKGEDVLRGGRGADHLFGGEDADVFKFNSILDSRPGAGRDVIEDFSHADGDLLNLKSIDANTKVAGNQAFHFVGGNAHSESFAAYHRDHPVSKWAGALRITASGVVQGDVNGDGRADFSIVVHGDHLIKGDFLL